MWPGKLLDCSRKAVWKFNLVTLVCTWLTSSIILWLQVVDCRVCGDPNSVLRFAFVEFTDEGNNVCVTFQKHNGYDEAVASIFLPWNSLSLILWWCVFLHDKSEGARAALSLGGTMLGYYPVRVLPSKTAIVPVNPTFLPRVRWASFSFLIWGFGSPDTEWQTLYACDAIYIVMV
jgi:hypothetical protein